MGLVGQYWSLSCPCPCRPSVSWSSVVVEGGADAVAVAVIPLLLQLDPLTPGFLAPSLQSSSPECAISLLLSSLLAIYQSAQASSIRD